MLFAKLEYDLSFEKGDSHRAIPKQVESVAPHLRVASRPQEKVVQGRSSLKAAWPKLGSLILIVGEPFGSISLNQATSTGTSVRRSCCVTN